MREIRPLRAMWRGLETDSRCGFQGTSPPALAIQPLTRPAFFSMGDEFVAQFFGLLPLLVAHPRVTKPITFQHNRKASVASPTPDRIPPDW